jgi:hypothetical protein
MGEFIACDVCQSLNVMFGDDPNAECLMESELVSVGSIKYCQMSLCESCYEKQGEWIYTMDQSQHCTGCKNVILAEIEESGGDPEEAFERIDIDAAEL